ncbi:hypothetical protein [uncultured Brachyspira sp.]|uniref:hypothetical protein n=1 Tax=uncultured Brachyspira sp. TaxID=221953 RepID=UPI0025926F7F|nr:hypothetical protein [uncultured Brachyspira sp.]
MNNTKTIFKSLLIMIVAISLFTVSCSKDEGGTKTPTNPTPKNSEALLTDMLKGLGELKDTDKITVILNLANIDPQNGSAEISGANNSKQGSDYKVVTVLKETFKKANFTGQITLKEDLTTITAPTGGNNNPLSVEITFIANTGYTFDTSITEGKRYTYTKGDSSAKLTLKISPKGNWQS